MVKVIWTDPAIDDLKSIKDYVSRESEIYALQLVERIINRVDQLINFPKSGRIVPEFEIETLRELIGGNYRIIYKIKPDHIGIVRVHHGKMLLTKI